MATVETALHLASLGFSIFPVVNRDKMPLIAWSQFQRRRAVETEIKVWWKLFPDANIGIVTGEISDLFVVDLDGPESIESARKLNLPPTWIVKTSKGWHYYYRWPGPVAKNSVRIMPGIDIRTDGGFVVGPGSIHETGHVYAWELSPDEMPRQKLPVETIEKISRPERKNEESAWAENRFAPATEGARNDSAARLVGYLLRKRLSKPEIVSLMRLWNCQNRPPIDDGELASVIESIWKREPLGENAETQFSPVPLDELILRSSGEITYLWKPWIESNGLALLVAMPKVGKSVFCAHLAKAVTSGQPFLGGETRPGKVLMIELEESNQRLVARCKEIGIGKDVFVHMGKLRTTDELYSKLEAYIVEKNIRLVILNTLVRFLDVQDENDARQIAKAMAPLLDLRQRVDCAFLLVHHSNKMDDESPRGIRGSGDLFASVDTAMILRADDPTSPREMLSWGRDPLLPYKVTMKMIDGELTVVPNIERRKAYRS